MVSAQDIERMAAQAEQENSLFAAKGALDTFSSSSKTQAIGREAEAGQLVKALAGGQKQGYVSPFVFVYGRSGSGKSTVVQFVCEHLPRLLAFRLVNLRRVRTVYGCACLILEELGGDPKGGQTIDSIIERIAGGIEALAAAKFFVLVLDEFDVLLHDKRGRASDFVYKLLAVQQKLREEKGCMVCVIAISNNVMAAEEMDDRVRSRIGSCPEVFFDAYQKEEVVAILKDRAARAFVQPVGDEVIEYCAEKSSQEHGDARRAIDLLRMAAEIAGAEGGKNVSKLHIDMAEERLQKDRVERALSQASYHQKVAAGALVRITYLTQDAGESWYSTSTLYRQYCMSIRKTVRPLSYRRVAELFSELESAGLAVSRTGSKGRHGYGREYKLTLPPEVVGSKCLPDWWKILVEQKKKHEERMEKYKEEANKSDMPEPMRRCMRDAEKLDKESWAAFVGL
ncbi:orc1/cdc6 family replication initiation protein [Candidatus Nitrososphaera evergladensis SR1]|uniref:ORC1-type DNA replication protein n=1 Tax=Candidatus Nitrososphaera evergladensis SR1 TaxID=1459636 RepID=A0A075MLR9_9ARCH|nr:AAA family ATPase [Candidatus Nitrososphaera evergladensis]AIF82085.1 orc1/cdc6 family replication initiation protein [Candidatus Nitrososphaera evergladensis SR1]